VVARRARDRAHAQRRRFGRLVVVALGGNATDVSKGWHTGLDWGSAGIVCIRSGGRTAPQLAVVDPATGARDVRRRGAPARARRRRSSRTHSDHLARGRR
jgi:hypothetical protein